MRRLHVIVVICVSTSEYTQRVYKCRIEPFTLNARTQIIIRIRCFDSGGAVENKEMSSVTQI